MEGPTVLWDRLRPESAGVDDEGGQGQKDHRHDGMGYLSARKVKAGGQYHDGGQADGSPRRQNRQDFGQSWQDQAECSSQFSEADKRHEPALISQSWNRRGKLIEGGKFH